jgi:integrase
MENHSMRQESKSTTGSVVRDRRSKKWQFFWWADGRRHSKTLGHYPTKAAAWNAAQQFRIQPPKPKLTGVPTVALLVDQYRAERMPKRKDTKRTYEAWISNHIMPKWGDCVITDLEPRPLELWLASLPLAPKSKVHIRGLLRNLWDFAAWSGDLPSEQRNPMELVRIQGASKRTHKPRSLTVDEFQKFAEQLAEPFLTIALLCCCLGLRISECLALKWSDVDWLNGRLLVERGIVCQQVDDVKTSESRKRLVIAGELLTALQTWKQAAQFSAADDWVFASPFQLGKLPWSYNQVYRVYQKAAKAAGIGGLGTHSLRHTFRTWLGSVGVGTPVGVQQQLMRHADIRTTMNVYGDAVTVDMEEAHHKIVGLALNSTGTARKAC